MKIALSSAKLKNPDLPVGQMLLPWAFVASGWAPLLTADAGVFSIDHRGRV